MAAGAGGDVYTTAVVVVVVGVGGVACLGGVVDR
jgi:hypothetical protein